MTASDVSRPTSDAVLTTPNPRRQTVWNYMVFALTRGSTMIMTVVLARLLRPEDFGLFALGLVMLNLFDYVRDFGVTAALVQSRERLSRLAPTGLSVSIVFGIVVASAAVLLAPVVSALLDHPELTDVVRVLAVALLISSFNALPQATLRRGLQFGRRLVPEVGGALVKMAVSITCAALGQGVWSLVWGQLAGTLVTTTLYWAVARPSLRLAFDRSIAVSLLRFGLPVTAVTFLAYLVYNLPAAIVGRRLGSEDVGYYSLGYRLAELTVLSLCVVVSEVLFSALSRLQDDRDSLVEGYLSAVGTVVAITFPVGLGIAAIAPDVVDLLYGARYSAASAPLAALAIFVALHSATFHSGDVYKAIGRPAVLTYLSVGGLIVLVPAVWIAAGHSLLAVAATLAVVELMNFSARVVLVRNILGPTIRRQLAMYWGPAAAALTMAALVWATAQVLPAWPAALRVMVFLPIGAVVYPAALRLLAPSTARALLTTVSRLRHR